MGAGWDLLYSSRGTSLRTGHRNDLLGLCSFGKSSMRMALLHFSPLCAQGVWSPPGGLLSSSWKKPAAGQHLDTTLQDMC